VENKLIMSIDYDRLEIVFKREFDAPRELVWKTITDPALIPHWWGPARMTTIVDKMDVRPGGEWRFIQRAPDGTEFGFNGIYKEVVPPERLVQTLEFEPMAGHISVETATLSDLPGGRTLWVGVAKYATLEDLKGVAESGMETGATETYNRLDALLAAQTVAFRQ
jgi:uncharacterized protein YndB with AHSA1/START domain